MVVSLHNNIIIFYVKNMARNPNVKCIICEKPLYRRPSEMLKTNLFCCREHRGEMYKRFKNYNNNGLKRGSGWNKGKSIKNGDILKYAKPRSDKAKHNIQMALSRIDMSKPKGKDSWHWIENLDRYKKCLLCEKNFIARLTWDLKNNNYCSKECFIIMKKNNPKIGKENPCWKEVPERYVKCDFCKKDIIIPPSRLILNKKHFCSKNCQNNFHSLFMINTPPMVKKFDTNIELIIESWLKENSIIYHKQFIIKDICCVDFFIEPNIIIQCDGNYWHSTKKAINRDAWCNRQLKKKNYKVIRLLGSEILKGKRPDLQLFKTI